MERGGFAAARPSIVRTEIGGTLAWNRGHLPFNHQEQDSLENQVNDGLPLMMTT